MNESFQRPSTGPTPSSQAEAKAAICNVVASSAVALVTSVDERFGLVSRPMIELSTAFDGALHFLTVANSRIAAQITAQSTVNVCFVGVNHWLSLAGTARTSTDTAAIEQVWNTTLSPWLPAGVDTAGITLIEVSAYEARYWQAPNPAEILIRYVTSVGRRSASPTTRWVHLHPDGAPFTDLA
ncbi:MAG: pyridoxamine 5'-phosphate oxidase family protein [Rhodococcus sp. (in: high G+C Gram-positive bacteria)]|uniref:pyridoxamine 5'-phosphate oxidase family protein n=1 Tax=Rhodococcus sp. TaxID=1831 RepID=UPI002AD816A1|nr:pyridoxamine 5'-phosphate oxidase family protein [Rhodococcus sp. (in: high G+C Gram-positive bacteria)]